MTRGSNYEIVEWTDQRVLIQDLGPWDEYLTVTNDAEAVVRTMAPLLNGRELHYVDSDGNTDQIVVRDGRFAGFAPARG